MFLPCTDGTHRKTKKCTVFDTALNDKDRTVKILGILPDLRTMHPHDLDLTASTKTFIHIF